MTCASFIFFAAVRIAQPSPGLAVDDLIVYTHDVTEFGADRQGKSDSTDAIQSALDAAAKEKGGTVYLPAGRYRVGGRLSVRGGVTLRGKMWGVAFDAARFSERVAHCRPRGARRRRAGNHRVHRVRRVRRKPRRMDDITCAIFTVIFALHSRFDGVGYGII